MHTIQVINDLRGFRYFLLCRGNRHAHARRVVWTGTNAHQAFLALYRTMGSKDQ